MYVNVYLVYLNSNKNYKDNPGQIVYEDKILGVGIKYDETLHFPDSKFSSNQYPDPTSVNSLSKLKDRRFEPEVWNGGKHMDEWNTDTTKDWYKVTDKTFEIGICKVTFICDQKIICIP